MSPTTHLPSTEGLSQPNASTSQNRVSMSATSRTTTTRIAPRACNTVFPLQSKQTTSDTRLLKKLHAEQVFLAVGFEDARVGGDPGFSDLAVQMDEASPKICPEAHQEAINSPVSLFTPSTTVLNPRSSRASSMVSSTSSTLFTNTNLSQERRSISKAP